MRKQIRLPKLNDEQRHAIDEAEKRLHLARRVPGTMVVIGVTRPSQTGRSPSRQRDASASTRLASIQAARASPDSKLTISA